MHNRFSFSTLLLLLAVLSSALADDPVVEAPPSDGLPPAHGLKPEFQLRPSVDGRQLVSTAAGKLLGLSGLDCEFHYKLELYGESLAGSGRYLQSGDGPEKLFRLELSTQLDDYKATQQTICGKQYLWIRRDFGPEQRSLARVSLRRLRQAIEDAGPPLATDPSPTWLGVVGLPKMLTALAYWFEFDLPQEATLADRRVRRVRGVINKQLKAQLLSAKQGRAGEQIPDAVELTLGTDRALPLFPYRIEYFQRSSADRPAALSPTLTLDFTSVKIRGDLDPQQFDYFPNNQEVEDRTRLFLERLGFQGKEEK